MHKYIFLGKGKWGPEEEEAYKAYKQTGKFVYQKGFTPKGYKEGEAVPVTPHKQFLLQALRIQRMEILFSSTL